jgi:signal peptidase I
MAPTIKKGETVTVDYAAYAVGAPMRWDVIAFVPPMFTNQVWLMRIVGLPGESVAFAGGSVTVGGRLLALPSRIANVTYVPVGQFGVTSPFVVPNHCYFVLGDNSTNSNDSRFWGALPRANVLGRVGNK